VSEGAGPIGLKRGQPLARLLHQWFGLACAAVLAVLALLTFADVGGRYLFNRPVYGAYELIEILMGALIFTALPVVTYADRHITIDLLDSVTPRWAVRPRDFLVNSLSAAGLGVIAWQLFVLGNDKATYNDMTSFLRIPHAPVMYAMAGLAACSSAAAAIAAFLALSAKSRRDLT
jgi:TRAP-type C4-dicarboxylate transport system permease small subunit